MSKRKARLIRTDNFFINQYYNLYDARQPIYINKSNFFKNTYIKKNRNFLNNTISLKYGGVYKKLLSVSTKKLNLNEVNVYPLYMKQYFMQKHDINYTNSFFSYNHIDKKRKFIFYISPLVNSSYYDQWYISSYKRKYGKAQGFFKKIYKLFLQKPFEKEDQNKLIIRKHNLRKHNSIFKKKENYNEFVS